MTATALMGAHRGDGEGARAAQGHFDSKFGAYAWKIFPGEHRVTDRPDHMLVTVLGSCVAACVRDPQTGRGGMNHFVLPGDVRSAACDSAALRYGAHAMESLINDVLSPGGRRQDLEVKVFGGADSGRKGFRVGRDNARFVCAYLQDEGIPVAVCDLGGTLPRRVHFFPATGKTFRRFLSQAEDEAAEEARIRALEADLRRGRMKPGAVELFD